jgi:hypothetical protein
MNAELLKTIETPSVVELKDLYQASTPAHLALSAVFWDSYVDFETRRK